MENKKIGLFVGSLRKAANSKRIAEQLKKMAPSGFEFVIVPMGQLPLYNQDFDDDNEVPETYVSFRKEVAQLDGVIFITPEYNRSVPAVLKNAIDVASRPYGKNMWDGKPGAVISSSSGSISGFGANHHLRQSLTFLNVPTLQQPEAYLANLTPDSFNEDGSFKDLKTTGFLQKITAAYIEWFRLLKKQS